MLIITASGLYIVLFAVVRHSDLEGPFESSFLIPNCVVWPFRPEWMFHGMFDDWIEQTSLSSPKGHNVF